MAQKCSYRIVSGPNIEHLLTALRWGSEQFLVELKFETADGAQLHIDEVCGIERVYTAGTSAYNLWLVTLLIKRPREIGDLKIRGIYGASDRKGTLEEI